MYHYVLPLLSQLPFPHCVKGKASWILLRHFTPGCKKTKGPQVNDASETSFIESNKTCGRISSISLLWYISRVKSNMRNNVFWSVWGCFELSKHRVRQLEWWFLIDAELYVFYCCYFIGKGCFFFIWMIMVSNILIFDTWCIIKLRFSFNFKWRK